MYSNRLYSPLRYPGGKASFAPFISRLIRENNLVDGHYLEPYAGGAGVALDLLFHKYASHVHINDADPAVYAFWVSCTQYSKDLLELLGSTPINMDEWFKWRSILRGEITSSIVEKGFATLFMNRTNRSGILKAGVIGGKSQEGKYKVDARFKKDVIAKRIKMIADRKDDISVYDEDSLDILKRSSSFLPKKSLIYLDPPYYLKGKGLYRNYYNHDDHVSIANLIQENDFSFPWVVSYDNTEEIRAMYQPSKSISYGLNYTAQKRYIGNEVMFFSQDLTIPKEANPTKMTGAT
tara:strand:+ start:3606 stop:4484 length:879 start_codon:yes stop_codon:yes gene_type:complete